MENNKSREWLYNKFTAKGLNVGSYAQFDKALTDNEDSRKWAYNKAREFGYNVGADYDAFNAKINPTQQPTPQPTNVEQPMAQVPEPMKSDTIQPVQPIQSPKAKIVDNPDDYYPTLEQNTRKDVEVLSGDIDVLLNEAKGASARKYAEQTTEAAKGGFWKAIQNAMVNTAGAVELADAQAQTPQKIWGGGIDRDAEKEINDYKAAEHALENARRTINEADINAKNGTLREKMESTFVGGMYRGFGQKLFDVRTWDMGVSDFKDQSAINDALDAAENGTLTESQEVLLNAKAQEMAVQAYFGSYVGRGYKAGSVTAESLPFMLEMCINPASTLGKSASSRLARWALKKFGTKTAETVGRVVGRALGDVAAASAMTATTGAIRTAADAMERMSGGVAFDTDEQGHAVFDGRYETPEDVGMAFKKAFAATTIENYSEMLGSYFAPMLGVVGKGTRGVLDKITSGRVGQFLDNVAASDFAKAVSAFERNAQWSGNLGEFAEELAGGTLNAIIVGDQTFDSNPETGVFNRDNLIDTFLGVTLLGGSLSMLKTAGYGVEKYQQKRAVKRADVAAADAFGSVDVWDKIKTEVDAASNEELPVLLGNIIGNPDVTDDQKTALMVYVGAKQREKGAVIGEQKRRENPDVPQEQVEVEQSFDNGAALETPQEKNDAQNMFEYQQQQMRQYFGLGEDGDVDAFLGDDPIAGLQRVSANDQEAGQVILDYLNAKATVDGVFQRMSDDAEAKIAEADAIIASRTNRNNGKIQRVRLKNDKQAYVLSGDIVMTDDGDMVNVSKSSESLVVIDAITGKKEYTYPSNIAEVYQSVDAEAERQTLHEQVIDEYSQKLADDMNGTLAFAPGDNYTLVDDQGAQHNVQIVADNGDGTVAVVEVMPDGVQQEAVMAKSTIQEMSDTHNQLRLGQYLQDKQAQEIALAEQEQQGEQSNVVAEQQPVSAMSRIPTNEAGEQLFEQAPVQDTWAALVELNEGDTAEAVDTAQQMYNNAKKELDKAQKQKPKVGTSVAEIQSNKAEYKARVSAAQAKADYWANIVALGEQLAQPNEQTEEVVAENVVAEEAAPVAEQTEVTPEVVPVAEEVVEPVAEQPLVDHQGNPIDANGQLIVDIVESVDELSDDDFNNPTRSIQLPKLPKAVDDAIGADGKPIIIKKNIFERNLIRHSDVTPEEGRLILNAALYNPNIYGQNQKERKPYNWVVVSVGGENGSNKLVLLEVNKDRERVEVVHWHFINQHGLEKLKRQAEREDGQLLILPSETSEEVGALSDPTLNQPSESKDTTTEPITQEVEQENLQEAQNEQQVDVENVEQTDVVAEQTIEETPAEEKTPAPLQLAMSNEEFDRLLASDNREQIEAYLKELDQMLVIDENSPFVGEEALREEFKQVVEQYGGKDKVPAEVMDSFNARYQPYADLQRAIYDRKYALGEKLAQLNEQQTTNDKQKESEAKTAHKQTAFNGFLANKTDLAAATAEKALQKKYKFEDKNYTVAEYVEQAVASGNVELKTKEVPKYAGASRRAWNKMDAREQAADAERVKNSGTKTEYYVNGYDLGKTGYDYAQYLQAKAKEQAPETASESQPQSAVEPEWLQKVPTDGRNFMVYTKVAGENNYSATDLKTGQAVGLVYASLVKRDRLQSLVEELPKVLLEGAHFQIRDTNGKIYYSSEPITPTKGKKKATTKMTTLKTVSGAEVKVPINLYKYVSTDKTRAYTGVYFDPEGFVVATDGRNMIAVKHDVAEADAEKFISKAGDVASTIFKWRIANPKPNTEKPMNVDFEDVEKQIGGKAGDKFVVFEIDRQEVGFPPKAIHVLADFQRAFGGQAFVGDMTAGKAIVIRSGDNYAIALQITKYADLSQAIHIPSGIEQTTEQVEQPAAVSEQAPQPSEPTKQEPKPKRTADRKIEDYGEKIAGARKDILRNMSKNFDNATIESLVALPFAKAFVKPDLKKLVEAGVLRPDDAKYAEAIMWVYINKNKPKARKTDVWAAKRGRETRITAWAKKTFDGITRLRDFIEADEATRDELIAQYGQLGEQIKANEDIDRVRLNRLNGGALVFGDLYSPNPIEVVVAALDKLNYQAGDNITFDAPIVKAEYLGRYFNFENQDGEKVYAFSRADSIEEAIDTLVLQAKIRRGDTDIQYPTYMFSITREDPIKEPSGMFTVFHINKRVSLIPETVEGREAAEKKVADYQSQGLSADVREEKKVVGYATHRIRFKNRLTDVETIFDEKFGSEGEARQALEERYDEFNDLANDYVASLSKQKREQPIPFEVTTSWNSETKVVKYVVKNTETGDVMSPQLDSRKEAEEYYKSHIEEWKAKWQEMKDARKKFVFFDDNVKPREGKDYRNGRDVTAEDLATTFGFRGIQFGNWTNDADRQAALNQAYDAFMDLADILGVSPKALSLAGELGIAFGARGGGSALAHYEPDEIVINLTKTKGAGSLAHEWWHALDNYFSRQGNIPMGFVTSNPTEAKMREEMRAAWQGVVKAVKGTEYAKRSMAQGDYWGRMLEMTARLFGEWTVYELAKTGRTNHFLSRGITPGRFDMWRRINYAAYKWSLPEDQTPMPFEEFALLPRSLKGMPFPTKEETEQMGEAVRNLFDVVQEKVDEQGNVVLFQRGDFPEMPNTEANRRAYKLIREKLRKKGIEVHEVSEEVANAMASLIGAEFATKRKSAPETESPQNEDQPSVVSSADGAKILKNLDSTIQKYEENAIKRPNTFLGDVAKAIKAKKQGSGSQYATFEAINGKVFTIRLADHNAKASTFDNHNEKEGISIIITESKNGNLINDGNAHIVEYYYDAVKLRKESGLPLVEILKSIKQALYSGEYKDTTKLAKVQEINADNAEYQIVYHGSGAKFDRFDHSFMGTGEGAQAYGYGTYVTQVEGIGKTYAEQVSYKRGDNIEFLKYQLDALDGNIAREKEDLEWHIKQTTAIDKWLSEAQEEYDNFTKEAGRLKTEFGEESPEYRNYIFYDYQADELDKAKRSKVDNAETIAFKRDRIATLEYDRNKLAQDIANWTPPTAYLYSVDVPESNGGYLQWEKTVSKYLRKKLIESVTEGNFGFWVPDHLREASREARAEYWMKETYPDNPHSGEAVYNLLSVVMGSARAASAYLRDNGFVGIEYPAQYRSGGRADNAKNYVIFNENDLKIIDRVELLQDSQGKIYGWAVGGEIYLTPDGLNANTAIHEYSHLWAEAMRQKDSKKWGEIKSQLKATPFWQQVLDDPNYENIRENEDAVASEVLARLSGNKGAERLAAETQRIIDAGNGNLMARVESSALVQHVKRLLRDFYAWVARNVFGVTNEATISQLSDMVVDDLLDEVALDNIEGSPYEAQIADGQEDTDDGVRYRSDVDEVFDADFAELDSEYQQIDKNDEQAMAKWRAKKKRVVENYLNYMTDDLALPASVFVYDHNDKGSLDEAVRLIAEVVADKLGENVEELYLPDHKKDLDEFTDAIAAFTEVGRIINGRGMYNVGRAVDNNEPLSWFGAVVHENAHHLLEGKHTEQEFADIWNEAVENEAPIVSKIQEHYATETNATKGEEVVAFAVGGYAGSKHTHIFASYIKGDGEVSLDDIMKKLNKSLPLRNELVIEVLNKLRDEYQRQETEVNTDRGDQEANREREAARQGQESSERSPRQDSQTSERESGRYVRGDNAEGYGQFGYNLNAIATAAEELAKQLNTPIRIIGDVSEINDDDLNTRRRKRSYKGWYDVSTGEVVVVAPNATSVADVQRTVIHEVVAHNGLRELFGADFDTFLDNVYRNVDEPIRRAIANLAARKGWDFRVATEEYLASLAETTNFDEIEKQGWWQKIKDYFMDLLRKVGIKLAKPLTNDELRYILWRSYQMQKSKGAMAVAEDVDMQRKLGVGNFRTRQGSANGNTAEINSGEFDPTNPDIRSRAGSGSFATPTNGIARDIYNEKVRTPKTDTKRWDKEYWSVNTAHRLHEAYVDSMAGLKTLQEAILKETGNEIHSYEDAYKAENRMSSENKAQAEIYMRDFFQPLMDEVGKLSAKGATLDDIKMYLIAKHGLERNVIFSQRAAAERGEAWDGTVEDYSGLTDLTGEDKDFQAAAQHLVQDFEAGYDTKPLWDKINAATKESLRINYESGLMSKETYDKVRTMFAYYVPLRGWDRNVAADEYEYLTSNRPMLSPTLKTAKGRKSLADDPIATIGYMAESAIIQGNRNLMKQKFLNFVLNNPTSLATVSEQWYVRSGDEWVPSTPDIPADATADEVDAIVKAHEQKMEALGDDATKKRDGLKIGLHTTAREGQEHVIRVKRAGKEYCIYINGNPIAAQAINGLTNPNTDQNAFEEVAQGIKNLMARASTSQNPAFIVTNLSRDVIWAGTAVAVKEDKAYAAQYAKNVTKILATFKLPVLLRKFQNGTLDMNNDIERYFAEFIRNGGETGFTQINTVEDYKRDIERMVKDAKGETSKLKKAWQATWGGVEFLNRSAEDITRFSVYMTSRQMGRDVARSVWDAKEITVNFNKKGRGTFGASIMNFAYIFFNASIQGLANFCRLMYHHPKKMILALSTFASAGMIAPMFSILLSALLGDDDDNYWDLPEWVRRNNIVLFNPFSERGFFTIPLPHELRPFYGMGELFVSVMMGEESVEDALGKAARGFADLLPIDVTGNGGNMAINLLPTVAQPVAQLIANTDYFGVPIYRRNDYNELDPDWTKAYKGTNPFLVESAKWLNEVTGGDNVVKGKADINPAIVEHLFESYLGGMGMTFNKTVTTFSMLFNKDAREWRNVPVLSSFYQVPNDRTSGSQVNREYSEARDEADKIAHQFSGYKKQLRMGAMEYAEKLDELMKSPIFARYQLVNGYNKMITNLNTALKQISDPTDREQIETTIMELKAEMLAELEKLDAQTNEDASK